MDVSPFCTRSSTPTSTTSERLARTRSPDAVEGAGSDYGVDPDYLRELVASWRNYDWRADERRLNELPHFRATVDGVGAFFRPLREASYL